MISLCVPLTIQTLSISNNGLKDLNSIKWTLLSVTPAETDTAIANNIAKSLLDQEYSSNLKI